MREEVAKSPLEADLMEIRAQHGGNKERPLKGPVFTFGDDLPESARGHLQRAAELLEQNSLLFSPLVYYSSTPTRSTSEDLAGIIGHSD